MSTERSQKLKTVLEAVPSGYLVDAAWLTNQGIAYETFRDYVKRGWLKRITRGVFQRPTNKTDISGTLEWKTCLLSMQHIMRHSIHVGGATALAQQGYDHYLRLGNSGPIWVYGDEIPGWLTKLPLNAPIVPRNTSLFSAPPLGLIKDEELVNSTLPWDWKLRMSTPERAVMEAMDELPDNESFHNLDMVFESLTTLRPKLLSALLRDCKKIKVRRLFFVFADRHNHSWRKRLDPMEYNLGSGDRALVNGGKIHPRYRIMVPADFAKVRAIDGE